MIVAAAFTKINGTTRLVVVERRWEVAPPVAPPTMVEPLEVDMTRGLGERGWAKKMH